MDRLHAMLRAIRGESKSQPDHLRVFREFLDHLDRIGRRRGKGAQPGKRQPRRRRAGKR